MTVQRITQKHVDEGRRDGHNTCVQDAIDRVAGEGGGTVVLPAGLRVTTGTVILRSHVELHLEKDSAIEASRAPEHYASDETPALLEAHDAEEIEISGPGTIEGHGIEFMAKNLGFIYEPQAFRPRLLCFYDCRNVRFREVTFHDSPSWTVHLIGCEHVDIERITIDNDLAIPNCDGIDPDHCRDVTIRDCRITCADDAIVLKNGGGHVDRGPTENVRISGCTLMSTAGAFKIGTGTASDFRNISVTNCTIDSSSRGLVIQHRDQGTLENIRLSGFQIETRLFEHHYWGHAEPIHISSISRTAHQPDGSTPPFNPEEKLGSISGVAISDIEARSEGGIVLYAASDAVLEDVSLRGIDLRLEKWSRWPGGYLDVRPVDMRGSDVFVDPETDPGRQARSVPALLAHGVDGLVVDGFSLRVGERVPSYYSGPVEVTESRNVSVTGFQVR